MEVKDIQISESEINSTIEKESESEEDKYSIIIKKDLPFKETSLDDVLKELQSEKDFCDVIVGCDDKQLKNHKRIVSFRSPVLDQNLHMKEFHYENKNTKKNNLDEKKLLKFKDDSINCTGKFEQKSDLVTNKLFLCDFCDKQLYDKCYLRKHIKSVHVQTPTKVHTTLTQPSKNTTISIVICQALQNW